MLKKTIKYKDLDGNDVEEDFYFNLTKADLAELELSKKGGMQSYLIQIAEAEDGQQIVDTLKKIIMMSVGRRSEDGKRFIRNDEIREDFMNSDAFSELFMELATEADAAANFINSVMPADLVGKIASGEKVTNLPGPTGDNDPVWLKEGRAPTPDEIKGVTDARLLQEAFRLQNESKS